MRISTILQTLPEAAACRKLRAPAACCVFPAPIITIIMRASAAFVVFSTIVFSILPCHAGEKGNVARPGVFVSILPLEFFVRRVAGDLVDLRVLVGPGSSPHIYEPLPRQMAALARARLLFTIGVPFERSLLPKVHRAMPRLKVVDASAGAANVTHGNGSTINGDRHAHDDDRLAIEVRHLPGGGGQHLSHDDHHGCSVDGLDPHVWMSPVSARRIARNVLDALVELLPDSAARLQAGFDALDADLTVLHRDSAKVLAPFAGRAFFVYHPAYGHFANEYGLTQVSVEEGGKEPTPRTLAALIRRARAEGAKVVFNQPQFSASWAEAFARSIGARVEILDPLEPDYISNVRRIVRLLAGSLKPVEDAAGPEASGGAR